MDKKKKMSVFAKGMLLYALIFLLLVGIGLFILWQYMSAYEYSRPDTAMERFFETLDDSEILRFSAESVKTVDRNIQPQAEIDSFILDYIKDGGLRFAKISKESTQERMIYALLLGNEPVGRASIEQTGETKFGMKAWNVTSAYIGLENQLHSTEITVPSNCTVSVNGCELNENYIVKNDVHYTFLDELYGHGAELPVKYTYSTGINLGEQEISIIMPDGSSVPYTEEIDEDLFTDNCSTQQKDELKTFFDDFLYFYVRFTSGAEGDNIGNFLNVAAYAEYDSELYDRLDQAWRGLIFASSRGDSIKSLTLDRCMDVGGGYCVSQVTYLIDTLGFDGLVTTTNTMKILTLQHDDGEIKAVAMASIEGGLA